MHRRWLTPALIALIASVLLAPGLVSSATAAGESPGVPTVAAVAAVYPHYEGGEMSTTPVVKVFAFGKMCMTGKPIKGASSRSYSYTPGDSADYLATPENPSVYGSSMRFASVKSARSYVRASEVFAKNCRGVVMPDTTSTTIRFKLGQQRWGTTTQRTVDGRTSVSHEMTVRRGKVVIFAGVTSSDGPPPVRKAIRFARAALQAAG